MKHDGERRKREVEGRGERNIMRNGERHRGSERGEGGGKDKWKVIIRERHICRPCLLIRGTLPHIEFQKRTASVYIVLK